MLGVGPFSIHVVIVLLTAGLAWLVARSLARGLLHGSQKVAGTLILDALFVGLVVARLAYVARWWPDYLAAPWSIIAIGDGGFTWWLGLPVAVAFIAWRTRRTPGLRKPVLGGVLAGTLAWFAAGNALSLLQQAAPGLPQATLARLDGAPVRPVDLGGQPVVINLWATWCPPCRREMPVFAQAEREFPGVTFLLINQGEGAGAIREYLASNGLQLVNVLQDPVSTMMRDLQVRALPATLFFDAQGRMVDAHLGEITMGRMRDFLARRLGADGQDAAEGRATSQGVPLP